MGGPLICQGGPRPPLATHVEPPLVINLSNCHDDVDDTDRRDIATAMMTAFSLLMLDRPKLENGKNCVKKNKRPGKNCGKRYLSNTLRFAAQ